MNHKYFSGLAKGSFLKMAIMAILFSLVGAPELDFDSLLMKVASASPSVEGVNCPRLKYDKKLDFFHRIKGKQEFQHCIRRNGRAKNILGN